MERRFHLEGLDCPECAAELESEIAKTDGVNSAHIDFVRELLTVEHSPEISGTIGDTIRKIVRETEPEVTVSDHTEKDGGADNGENRRKISEKTIKTARLICGAVLFALGLILGRTELMPFPAELCVLVAAYVILGYDVVAGAVRNLLHGHFFDEKFLMTVSTAGAFCIGEYPEAVAVMLFYQLGEFFQDLSVERSRRSISDLMDIRPDSASVKRGGVFVTVSPADVAVGELIFVRPGEKIPLDGKVVDGESALDTRALTGESVPKRCAAGDTALSGCINLSGTLTIEVTKQYGESTVSKIMDLVENASSKKAPTENFITAFARYYTPFVVTAAVLLAVIPPLFAGGGWAEWIHRAMVFLVISCPCALVISVPLTFFGGIGAASRHGVLVKGGNYLEALNKVDTVVFDKTGTLTKGTFEVTEVIPADGFEKSDLLRLAAHAESGSNHPIARSVVKAYGKAPDADSVSAFTEISGKGVQATVSNVRIAAGNLTFMEENGIAPERCGSDGTKVYVSADGRYAGCIVISDEIKRDSVKAVRELKKMGVARTVMLTGDDAKIAAHVAKEVGIDSFEAELLPGEKVSSLEKIRAELKKGSKLAFVGDGINDAPVLASADVGIAMGALGSDAAIEAADVVLMTDEPTKLADALRVARETKKIVIQNIVFALGVKAVFLLLGAFGIAGMWEAVFGDVGVALITIANAMRILKK